MAILNDVKQALGIFYSEANKDAEIEGIIAGAKAFFLSPPVFSNRVFRLDLSARQNLSAGFQ